MSNRLDLDSGADLMAEVHLLSSVLDVAVLPNNGADIYSVVDRASGIDVLFKTPWGSAAPAGDPDPDSTESRWLARYAGGWQQLVPNAGAERVRDGVLRGYHGEAAVVAWQVDARANNAVRLSTTLHTAPLQLTRVLTVDGPTLYVSDTIHNVSGRPTDVMWVQHPAFGAPFIDADCRLDYGAATFVSDADIVSEGLAPDTRFDIRTVDSVDGYQLRRTPAPHSGVFVLGALTDFDRGWCRIDSPSAGFGIRLDWDVNVYPHAWFWQECHATRQFPWLRNAYVVAVEPANVLHGNPTASNPERGQAPVLGPGQRWTSTVSLTRTELR